MDSDLLVTLIGWAFIMILAAIALIHALQYAVDRFCKFLGITWAIVELIVYRREFKEWRLAKSQRGK